MKISTPFPWQNSAKSEIFHFFLKVVRFQFPRNYSENYCFTHFQSTSKCPKIGHFLAIFGTGERGRHQFTSHCPVRTPILTKFSQKLTESLADGRDWSKFLIKKWSLVKFDQGPPKAAPGGARGGGAPSTAHIDQPVESPATSTFMNLLKERSKLIMTFFANLQRRQTFPSSKFDEIE